LCREKAHTSKDPYSRLSKHFSEWRRPGEILKIAKIAGEKESRRKSSIISELYSGPDILNGFLWKMTAKRRREATSLDFFTSSKLT